VTSTLQGGGRRGYRVDAEGAAGGLLVPETVSAITARTGEAIADSDATSPLIVGPLTSKNSVRGGGLDGGIPILAAPVTPATARYGDAGDTTPNLVAVEVASFDGDVAHALTAEGADASEPIVAYDLKQITSPDNRSNPREGDPAPVMTTHSKMTVAGPITSAHRGTPNAEAAATGQLVPAELGVRRLTPMECERLQGYPDGWTAGQSDSARYRQLGNAVPLPVAEWIAARLVDVADRYDTGGPDA
jgi:DNA (cytosine-5)-methyltransferase 1